MLRRKIEKDIINWFEKENKALLIDVERQVFGPVFCIMVEWL